MSLHTGAGAGSLLGIFISSCLLHASTAAGCGPWGACGRVPILSGNATCINGTDFNVTSARQGSELCCVPDVRDGSSATNALVSALRGGDLTRLTIVLQDARPLGGPRLVAPEVLQAAQEAGADAIAALLCVPGFVPRANGSFLLRNAVSRQQADVVAALLQDEARPEDLRADPSDADNEALVLAIQSGNSIIIEALLADPRVDPSAQQNRALLVAVAAGSASSVTSLLKDPRVSFDVGGSGGGAHILLNLAGGLRNADVLSALLEDPRCCDGGEYEVLRSNARYAGTPSVARLFGGVRGTVS